jgi:hypothetical protein
MIRKICSAVLATVMAVSLFAIPVSAEWLEEDGKIYWIVDGEKEKGFEKIEDSYYYFKSADGSMAKGWLKVNGNWYYFSKTSGKMLTGKSYKIDGDTYTFGSNGKVKAYSSTGWGDYLWGSDYEKIGKDIGDDWGEETISGLVVGNKETPLLVKQNENTVIGRYEVFMGIDGKLFAGGYTYFAVIPAENGKTERLYNTALKATQEELEKLYKNTINEAEKRCGERVSYTDKKDDEDFIEESKYVSGNTMITVSRYSDMIVYSEASLTVLAEGYGMSVEDTVEKLT